MIKFIIKFWIINNFVINTIKKGCDFFFNLRFLLTKKSG